jgi:integrase
MDEQVAHQDWLVLCAEGTLDPRLPEEVTLQGAIDRVRRMDAERSIPESTLRCMVDGHGRCLTRFFGPDVALAAIDEAEIRTFVRRCLEDGRNPTTLRTKDLPLLRRAAEAAGHHELAELVTAVRKDLSRSALKGTPPRMVFFRPDELADLLAKMRRRPVLDRQNHRVDLDEETATYDADLVQLIALTGIRVLELSRVTLADIERGVLYVRLAKDKTHPREIPISEGLAPVIERLERHARAVAGPTVPRAQVVFVPDAHYRVNRACRRWMRILGEPRLAGRVLRHSYVTAVLATGGTSVEAMAAAGHRNLRTTDRYVHAISSQQTERQRLVEAALGVGQRPSGGPPPAAPAD